MLTRRSGHVDRTLDLSVWSPDDSHVSRLQWSLELAGRCTITDQTLSHQRPVVSNKVLETHFAHRTRPVKHDRTLPSSGQRPLPLSATRQQDRTHLASVRSLSDPASGRLTDASVSAVTIDRTRRFLWDQRPITL